MERIAVLSHTLTHSRKKKKIMEILNDYMMKQRKSVYAEYV